VQPRLVVLDRDGVINRESPDFIRTPAEWLPLPGSVEAIARFSQAGFTVVVATNQSGLARGLFDWVALEAIHARMRDAVAAAGGHIDGIYVCPHGPDDGCDCRKPRPGLMQQIERAWHVSLAGVPAIGDSARDLEAARAVGARAILVRTGNGSGVERAGTAGGAEIFDDLAAAATALLAEPVR
jgi:D-glycero-D-manno-heptose 1,7-bisphosphate phosphatase